MTQVAVSEEQFAAVTTSRGSTIRLCYQTFGSPSDEPLLLVMGLGGPMTWWDAGLCTLLAEAGFYVIRFDNRDIGRSSRVSGRVGLTRLVRAFVGVPAEPPYRMSDLTADAAGILDAVGVDSAHVCGVSMGGMIAQTLAIEHPERVRSLVSVMSTTGRRTVGWQHPTVLPMLLAKAGGKEAYVAGSVKMARLIGSPAYVGEDAEIRARAAETYDRGVSSAGVGRQMLAILTQPDRSRSLARVKVPTTVVHGLADRMVHVSGGRATAKAVPGSELLLVPGMGHDIPPALWGTLVEAIRRTADRVSDSPADR